jgi:hypothetical protein
MEDNMKVRGAIMPNIHLIYTYMALVAFVFIVLPILLRFSEARTGSLLAVYRIVRKAEMFAALANTLIHELSHGLMAIVTGGKVHKITLHRDTSGLAITKTKRSRIIRALVAYAGYTGSSAAAVGLFYLLQRGDYHTILLIFLGITAVSSLFWVRNLYGFLWSASFLLVIGYVVYKQYTALILHASIFFSVVVLVDSITSAWTVCKLSVTNRYEAGDATSLAKATFIPAAVWGAVFFGQALYAGYYVMKTFVL